MSDKDRREFIKIAGILALGLAVSPRMLLGGSPKGSLPASGIVIPPLSDVACDVPVYGIIDMHSHPSQKLYLVDTLFWDHHYPRSAGTNELREQIDVEQLQKNGGRVMGMITTHYLPEVSTVQESTILDKAYAVLKKLPFSTLVEKVENEDMVNFVQLNYMMDQLEIQVDRANQLKGNGKKIMTIARNYKEFTDAIAKGIIPFAHAVEGSHSLGRIFPNEPRKRAAYFAQQAMGKVKERNPRIKDSELPAAQQAAKEATYKSHLDSLNISSKKGEVDEQIRKMDPVLNEDDGAQLLIENLKILKNRGVCLITLAHFFANDTITYPVFGISPDELHAMSMDIIYNNVLDPKDSNPKNVETEHPLSPVVGKKVVRTMFDIGILVDLTHTNPTARQSIFKLNKEEYKNKKPLVFSHSGAQKVFDKYCKENYSIYKNYSSAAFGDYNATDEEILQIQACNGIIGVIPEVFWLTGCDTHCDMGPDHDKVKKLDKSELPLNFHNGVRFMLETIMHIHKITGTYDNIAIGTDFDGLADASKNLYLPSQLGNLTNAMEKQGISAENIKKITSGNALRVLKDGWT